MVVGGFSYVDGAPNTYVRGVRQNNYRRVRRRNRVSVDINKTFGADAQHRSPVFLPLACYELAWQVQMLTAREPIKWRITGTDPTVAEISHKNFHPSAKPLADRHNRHL